MSPYHSSLNNITISNIVEIIGRNVLFGETVLNGIKLPESIKILNNNKFIEHDVNTVIIPNNITSIGYYAFSECTSLINVTIPNNVTSISKYAFYKCSSLTNITIPDSVTSIGSYAFRECNCLMLSDEFIMF